MSTGISVGIGLLEGYGSRGGQLWLGPELLLVVRIMRHRQRTVSATLRKLCQSDWGPIMPSNWRGVVPSEAGGIFHGQPDWLVQ